MPPLMVMGMVGAAGKTHDKDARRGCNRGKASSRLDDQPEGVSPKPCRKMRAAGLAAVPSLLVEEDARREDVDCIMLAAAIQAR